MPKTDHKQCTVIAPPRLIEVDEELAGVLPLIWDLGLYTMNSCARRSKDGRAYIQFEHPWMALRFVKEVRPELFGAAAGEANSLIEAQTLVGERHIGAGWYISNTYFRYSVEFPPEAIAEIEAAFASVESLWQERTA